MNFFPPTLINVQPLLLPTTQKRQWKRKVIQISGEVDLFNNSCLGVSSIFFVCSSVLWQTPSTNQQLQCSLLTSRLHTGPSRCCPVLSAGRHQARTSNCGSILKKQRGSPTQRPQKPHKAVLWRVSLNGGITTSGSQQPCKANQYTHSVSEEQQDGGNQTKAQCSLPVRCL